MNLLDDLLDDGCLVRISNTPTDFRTRGERWIVGKALKDAIRAEIDARLKEALQDYATLDPVRREAYDPNRYR